ncbi:MAG: hypothetical protein ABIK09_04310 [Pseudomonadota bacterium]
MRPAKEDLIVLGVVLLFWSCALALGFFLDDLHNLEQALAAPWGFQGLARGFSVFDPATIEVWCLQREPVRFLRPLFVLSLKLDHAVWGFTAFGYHLTNLLLHGLNAVMVRRLLLRLRVAPGHALLAACLFAAFPHHTVAVLWISGRTEVLMATFVLGSLLLHLRARDGDRPFAARLGSLACAAAAFFTKEGAVTLPVFLALVEWMRREPGLPLSTFLRGAATRLWPVILLTALYLGLRLGVMGLGDHPPRPYYISPTDPDFPAFAAVKLVYYYFAWLVSAPIMPVAPVAFLIETPLALAAIVVITVIGWVGVARILRRNPKTNAWLLWTAAGLIPTLPLMASNHYTYLSNVGVAVLGAGVLLWIPRPRLRRVVGIATVLLFGAHALQGFLTYQGLEAGNREIARKVLEAAPELRDGHQDLYLVNLPFIAAHTGQRLRLLHGAEGLRTHLVTVSSEPFAPEAGAWAQATEDGGLSLSLPTGWIDGDLIRMFLTMGTDIEAGRSYPCGTGSLVPRDGPAGALTTIEVDWPVGEQPLVVVLGKDGDGRVTAQRVRVR